MKLKHIPVLCALPRIAQSLGDLFTADPEEQDLHNNAAITEAEILLKVQAAAMENMANRLESAEKALSAAYADKIVTPAPKTEEKPETIKTPFTTPAPAPVNIEESLNKLVEEEEKQLHPEEKIPIGFKSDGVSIDEKLQKIEQMRMNKTPHSAKRNKKRKVKKGYAFSKKRDSTTITRQMYDHVMESYPKFIKLQQEQPELKLTLDVFCRQMNRDLGTDKTITCWSDMYKGHRTRKDYKDAQQVVREAAQIKPLFDKE